MRKRGNCRRHDEEGDPVDEKKKKDGGRAWLRRGQEEGVDLWKFGGPAESTHRGLFRAKEGRGLGKIRTKRGPIREQIFDLRFRSAGRGANRPRLCYCSTGVAY